MLPTQYNLNLKSYNTGRLFYVKQDETFSIIKYIKTGVIQCSVLGPVLYLLYDIPQTKHVTISTYTDNTAILAVGHHSEKTIDKVQQVCNNLTEWNKMWRRRINKSESSLISFIYKEMEKSPITTNNIKEIPKYDTIKCLGIIQDVRLNWKIHIKKR